MERVGDLEAEGPRGTAGRGVGLPSKTQTKKVVESKVVLNLAELTDDKHKFRQWNIKLANALAHVEKSYGWAMECIKECMQRLMSEGCHRPCERESSHLEPPSPKRHEDLPAQSLRTSSFPAASTSPGALAELSVANGAAAASVPAEVPLVRSNNTSGYRGVHFNPLQRARKRPFQAVDKSGKSLGMYARSMI